MSSLTNFESYRTQSFSLLDEEFLATLSEQKERDIYARITALDINENPIDQLQGRVTGGTINIDGNSTVRRSCSLTMISENVDINDFYWGIKTKFVLEIGLRNKLTGRYQFKSSGEYPEIVWFPQGCYLVSTFNTSISTNNCTVSLQGKDKMCLLNGDLGGQLYASIDFGTEEQKVYIMEPVTINNITNSEQIVLSDYYIKPKKTDVKEVILGTDKEYTFILVSNKSILNQMTEQDYYYYKKNNNYYLYTGGTIYSQYSYYEMYTKIKDPSQLYSSIILNQNTYKPNTYYYKKDNNSDYYVLSTSKNISETINTNGGYYELTQLYEKYENITKKKITIEKIIREAVHTYANEPYHNIIINDLDDYGLEQLTYKGETPLYLLKEKDMDQYTQIILGQENNPLKDIIGEGFHFTSLNNLTNTEEDTPVYLIKNDFIFSLNKPDSSVEYTTYFISKINYGDDIGYRLTDLVYNGDLISSVGDSLTSVLDKIKQMLGDFEYFYDINGKFIFQRKKTYVETSWNQLTNNENEIYVNYNMNKSKFSFNFEGNRLISSIQNSPVLNNLRNDFIVWGKRKSSSGEDLAIHARYAIDKKPKFYKNLKGEIFATSKENLLEQINISEENYDYISKILKDMSKFKLNDELYPIMGLTKPKKNSNNTWSPGWWHILDWAKYYKIVTNSTEDPNKTMKFYSSGDENGCVSVNTLKNLPGLQNNLTIATDSNQTWLIEINRKNQTVSFRHGYGKYDSSKITNCTCYTSNIDSNGNIIYTITNETKNFPDPYRGCTNTHTYLYFLDKVKNDGIDVYFYNPQFPNNQTAQQVIMNQINSNNNDLPTHCHIVDWREIIYQMALDYFAGQGCSEKEPLQISIDGENFEELINPDHFLYEVGKRNPYYYPTGYTGYEQYYTDMEGFWRQLYNPDYLPQPVYSKGEYKNHYISNENGYLTKEKVWQPSFISDYIIDYYVDKENSIVHNTLLSLEEQNKDLHEKYSYYSVSPEDNNYSRLYWNKNVFENPEVLNFWIDFLDSDLELAQFSVRQVGDRTKVINDDKAKAIIYKEVPNFILYEYKTEKIDTETGKISEVCDISQLPSEIIDKSGYTFIYLPKGFSQSFTISYRNTSVKDKIDSLLYQYGYCIENISLTTIPVYYLQPNTRIFVQDKKTGINGEYIVNKITLPLTYNGTMSLSANKAPERLY